MSNLDILNEWGVSLIIHIQSWFVSYEQTLLAISRIGDPGYAFSIIFPIISTGNTLLAANIMLVSIVAEWANTLLKWLLREDRPYWWVRETDVYGAVYPHLQQGPLTCETGPGSPSGHVMGCAAMLYVLIQAFISQYSNTSCSTFRRKLLNIVFWGIYCALLVLVSISRLYVATHFPHQCVLGAILGYLIGRNFGNSSAWLTNYWHTSKKLRLLVCVLTMTGLSTGAYWLQKALGIDPQWSVKMAFKWCEEPENLNVNTTPLFSLVRDCGLGLGMVSVSPVLARSAHRHNLMVSTACVLAYCTALHMAQAAVPTYDAHVFYVCHALLYSTIPYVLIGVMPNFATVKNIQKTQ